MLKGKEKQIQTWITDTLTNIYMLVLYLQKLAIINSDSGVELSLNFVVIQKPIIHN